MDLVKELSRIKRAAVAACRQDYSNLQYILTRLDTVIATIEEYAVVYRESLLGRQAGVDWCTFSVEMKNDRLVEVVLGKSNPGCTFRTGCLVTIQNHPHWWPQEDLELRKRAISEQPTERLIFDLFQLGSEVRGLAIITINIRNMLLEEARKRIISRIQFEGGVFGVKGDTIRLGDDTVFHFKFEDLKLRDNIDYERVGDSGAYTVYVLNVL